MGFDKFVWHVDVREDRSEIEAAYIHGIIEWASRKLGKKYRQILDVPCGIGRLHPFLREYGYTVEGIDISEEMVQEAKEKGINCFVGDMTNPDAYPNKKYDVIINWFTSFGYNAGMNDEKILRIWRDHMTDNGLLIIDTARKTRWSFPNIQRRDDETIELIEETQEDDIKKLRMRLFKDYGDRMELLKELKVDLKLYSVKEMQELLERSGFEMLSVFGTLSFHKPYNTPWCTDTRAIYVAVKRDTK